MNVIWIEMPPIGKEFRGIILGQAETEDEAKGLYISEFEYFHGTQVTKDASQLRVIKDDEFIILIE